MVMKSSAVNYKEAYKELMISNLLDLLNNNEAISQDKWAGEESLKELKSAAVLLFHASFVCKSSPIHPICIALNALITTLASFTFE